MATLEEIKAQATNLAKEYAETEEGLKEVWWFKDENEIRIIDIVVDLPFSDTIEKIDIFSFKHSVGCETYNLLVGSIPPDKLGLNMIPSSWGSWQDAEKVYG